MAQERISVVPNPALLQEFQRVSPDLPAKIVDAGQAELAREFQYALVSLVFGGLVSLAIIGGFVFLVIQNHPQAAGALLGTGVLNIVTGFLRNRIRR
jgi:hypothetical protein